MFSVLVGVLIKGILIGVIGAIDGIIYLVGNRARFRCTKFCLVWALTGALCHFVVKATLSVAGSGSAHIGGPELALRLGIIALTLFVIFQGLEHIFHPADDHSNDERRWRVRELGTWLPVAILGSIDSGPLGFSKGLALGAKASPLALISNAALSSLILFLIIWGVAVALSLGPRDQDNSIASLVGSLGRLVHLGIFGFLGLTLAVDLGFLLHRSEMPQGCLWINATTVIIALRWFLWKPTISAIQSSKPR